MGIDHESDLGNKKESRQQLSERTRELFVQNMIRETDFFDEEIASLVGVEERLVECVRAVMRLDEELQNLNKPITDADRDQMISKIVDVRVPVKFTCLDDEAIAAQAGVDVDMVKRIRKDIYPRPSTGCRIYVCAH